MLSLHIGKLFCIISGFDHKNKWTIYDLGSKRSFAWLITER